MDGVNFKADTSLNENFQDIYVSLAESGWKYFPIKMQQGNGYSVTRFGAFIRDIQNPMVREKSIVNHGNFFSNSSVTEKKEGLTQIEKTSNNEALRVLVEEGVGNDYGCPTVEIDPVSSRNAVVKTLGDIPTVSRMKDYESSLVIAIDVNANIKVSHLGLKRS